MTDNNTPAIAVAPGPEIRYAPGTIVINIQHAGGNTIRGPIDAVLGTHLADGWTLTAVHIEDATDRPEWGDVAMDALIGRAQARLKASRIGTNTARETDADLIVISELITALASTRDDVISRSRLQELTRALGWAPNPDDFKPSMRAVMWAQIVRDAPLMVEWAALGRSLREQWPSHWSVEDKLSDLHARFHEQHGNLIGKNECGWERCRFWEGAKFALEDLAEVSSPSTARDARRIAICPECVQGKHTNCDGTALHAETDEVGTCECEAC